MGSFFTVYNPLKKIKEGSLPKPAEVFLALKAMGRNDDLGFPLITPSLCSEKEIDFEIDAIINDLNKVRTEAKSVLKKQQEKIEKSLHNTIKPD